MAPHLKKYPKKTARLTNFDTNNLVQKRNVREAGQLRDRLTPNSTKIISVTNESEKNYPENLFDKMPSSVRKVDIAGSQGNIFRQNFSENRKLIENNSSTKQVYNHLLKPHLKNSKTNLIQNKLYLLNYKGILKHVFHISCIYYKPKVI